MQGGKSTSPEDYFECLTYIAELIDSGQFKWAYKTRPLYMVKGQDGDWYGDIMYHIIKCKHCGKMCGSFADTYHGSCSFSEYPKAEVRKIWRLLK